jgi:hypothetical protein
MLADIITRGRGKGKEEGVKGEEASHHILDTRAGR